MNEPRGFDRFGRHINGAIAWPIFFLVSGTLMLVAVLAQLFWLPFDPDRRTCLWVNHLFWGHALFLCIPFWRLRRVDQRKIDARPCVLVCNHASVLDIPSVMSLPRPIRVVGRANLTEVPLMGRYMRFSRQIAFDASDPDSVQRFLFDCREALEAGISVLIFPEGTRSSDGQLGRFRRGAFRIAKDLCVPIRPVVVDGARFILGKNRLWPLKTFTPIHMELLDEVDPASFSTARALSNHVERVMKAALSKLQNREPAHADPVL